MGLRVRSIACGIFALTTLACGEEAPPPAPVVRPAKIFEVGGGGGGGTREFPGEIAASANTQIAFEVSGKLVEFPVKESERVERGQVLARLDGRDFEAALAALALPAGTFENS